MDSRKAGNSNMPGIILLYPVCSSNIRFDQLSLCSMKGLGKRIDEFEGLSLDSGNPLLLAQMCNSFAFVLVVKDFTLQS